jgi:protein-S-isoprenylcysteine O-methyltransferase Ste14
MGKMMASEHKTDHPGIKIPPPFIYIVIFLISLAIQKIFPWSFAYSSTLRLIGWIIVILGIAISMSGIMQFRRTKNSIVPIRPARSLQTNGIYAVTRNPMYTGLLLQYTGLAICYGNWWTFVLIVAVIAIIRFYVISKEEAYLSRAFGDEYLHYKRKVRRWI